MILKDEQIEQDNERWKNRDLKTELRYCGLNFTDRKHITNDELRFYAWLFRMALKAIEDMETRRSTELPRKSAQKSLTAIAILRVITFNIEMLLRKINNPIIKLKFDMLEELCKQSIGTVSMMIPKSKGE